MYFLISLKVLNQECFKNILTVLDILEAIELKLFNLYMPVHK